MAKQNAFSGGTAEVQYQQAVTSGFVRVGSQEVFVKAGETTVGTNSPLYQAAPQLFVPFQVTTWP
jgi:hypothetical protein